MLVIFFILLSVDKSKEADKMLTKLEIIVASKADLSKFILKNWVRPETFC